MLMLNVLLVHVLLRRYSLVCCARVMPRSGLARLTPSLPYSCPLACQEAHLQALRDSRSSRPFVGASGAAQTAASSWKSGLRSTWRFGHAYADVNVGEKARLWSLLEADGVRPDLHLDGWCSLVESALIELEKVSPTRDAARSRDLFGRWERVGQHGHVLGHLRSSLRAGGDYSSVKSVSMHIFENLTVHTEVVVATPGGEENTVQSACVLTWERDNEARELVAEASTGVEGVRLIVTYLDSDVLVWRVDDSVQSLRSAGRREFPAEVYRRQPSGDAMPAVAGVAPGITSSGPLDPVASGNGDDVAQMRADALLKRIRLKDVLLKELLEQAPSGSATEAYSRELWRKRDVLQHAFDHVAAGNESDGFRAELLLKQDILMEIMDELIQDRLREERRKQEKGEALLEEQAALLFQQLSNSGLLQEVVDKGVATSLDELFQAKAANNLHALFEPHLESLQQLAGVTAAVPAGDGDSLEAQRAALERTARAEEEAQEIFAELASRGLLQDFVDIGVARSVAELQAAKERRELSLLPGVQQVLLAKVCLEWYMLVYPEEVIDVDLEAHRSALERIAKAEETAQMLFKKISSKGLLQKAVSIGAADSLSMLKEAISKNELSMLAGVQRLLLIKHYLEKYDLLHPKKYEMSAAELEFQRLKLQRLAHTEERAQLLFKFIADRGLLQEAVDCGIADSLDELLDARRMQVLHSLIGMQRLLLITYCQERFRLRGPPPRQPAWRWGSPGAKAALAMDSSAAQGPPRKEVGLRNLQLQLAGSDFLRLGRLGVPMELIYATGGNSLHSALRHIGFESLPGLEDLLPYL